MISLFLENSSVFRRKAEVTSLIKRRLGRNWSSFQERLFSMQCSHTLLHNLRKAAEIEYKKFISKKEKTNKQKLNGFLPPYGDFRILCL